MIIHGNLSKFCHPSDVAHGMPGHLHQLLPSRRHYQGLTLKGTFFSAWLSSSNRLEIGKPPKPLENHRFFHWCSNVFPMISHGLFIVVPLIFHGFFIVFPLVVHGLFIAFPWFFHGFPKLKLQPSISWRLRFLQPRLLRAQLAKRHHGATAGGEQGQGASTGGHQNPQIFWAKLFNIFDEVIPQNMFKILRFFRQRFWWRGWGLWHVGV